MKMHALVYKCLVRDCENQTDQGRGQFLAIKEAQEFILE